MSKLIKQKLSGYEVLKSFQLGGAININEEKKKELFPYFAYIYSQKLNPEKYGTATSLEEWTALIQDNPEDVDIITEAAGQLSNDDWESISQQYAEAQQGEQVDLTKKPQSAAKGANLKMLKSQKTTPNKEVTKAISNPVLTKATGGKANIVEPKPTERYSTSKPIKSKTELNSDGTYKFTGKYETVTPTATKEKGGKVVPIKDKVKLIKKGSSKKCTCGCELIKSKAAGGKVIETCACKCGGKMKKKPMKKK